MKLKGGLAGIVGFLIVVAIGLAANVYITPSPASVGDQLTCWFNDQNSGFLAKWYGPGVTHQGNPLPANKVVNPGTYKCEAWVSGPFPGSFRKVGEAYVNVVADPCAGNHAPSISIPDQTLDEDTTIILNLTDYASDADNDSLQFTAISEDIAEVNCSIFNRTYLLIQPAQDWNGKSSCTVEAYDGCARRASTFQVHVNPVNDAPVLNLPNITMHEDSSYSIDLDDYAYDPDGDTIIFSFTGNENISIEIAPGNIVTFTSAQDWYGQEAVLFTAEDGNGGVTQQLVIITVLDVNDPPVVDLIPTIEFDEDSSAILDLNQYVSDTDNSDAEITWTYSGNKFIQITIDANNIANFSAPANWFGQENITFTATDPYGAYGQDNIMVIVNPVNDAPWIDPAIPDQTVMEDSTPWSIDLTAYQHDIETGPLTWQVYGYNASLLDIYINNGIATFVLKPHVYGTTTATFVLSDAEGATAEQNVTITVLHVNHAPEIIAYEPAANSININEGESLEFNITAYDIDNDALNYSWYLDGSLVSTTTNYSYYANDGPSQHELIAVVSDGLNSTNHTWQINELNVPPEITAVQTNEPVNEGSLLTISVNVSDPGQEVFSYSFDFNNDGSYEIGNSADNNASYTWLDNGSYPVKIVVNDNDGGIASMIYYVTIEDLSPNATAFANTTVANEGETILFNASLSTSWPDSIAICEWDWDFDGTFNAEATGSIAEHAWLDNGTYVVALRVIDEDGSFDYDFIPVTINDLTPQVDFNYTATSFEEPCIVTFVDNSYSWPDEIVNYSWDFDNDGTVDATGKYVSWQFLQDGKYLVTLTITDEDGSMNSTTKQVNISDVDPVAEDIIGDISLVEGEQGNYEVFITSYDGIVNYEWNFSDGNITTTNESRISHVYLQNGTYLLEVKAYEADGDFASANLTVNVADTSPVAIASANIRFIYEGEYVQFYGNESYAYDGIANYSWDFDEDGNIDNHSENPVWRFDQDDIYNVVLTVTDKDGSTNSTILQIAVIDIDPEANFTFTPASPLETDMIQFTDLSTTYDNITKYEWDFDNNGIVDNTSQNPLVQLESGTYNVKLTIYEADGDSDYIIKQVIVNDTTPKANFTYIPASPKEHEIITFISTSTFVHDPIKVWLWDFGDGSPLATGEQVNHSYAINDTYTVTLTIVDNDSSVDIYTKNITVGNIPANATLTVDPINGTEPLNVTIICSAQGNAPFTYNLDFGNGQATGDIVTSNSSITLKITYYSGEYNVICNVTDVDGDVASKSTLVIVNDSKPQADFYYEPSSPIEGQQVQFYDNSTYTVDPIGSWKWNFDNDSEIESESQNPTWTFNQSGVHNVTLIVTDIDGSSLNVTKQIIVNDTIPENVAIVAPDSAVENETISLACFANAYDQPLNYSWDFGNNHTAVGNQVSYAYPQNGSYTIICNVTDADGSTVSAQHNITILDTKPTADAGPDQIVVYEGQIVYFNASNSTGYDQPLNYSWDFGDGTNATGMIVNHTYLQNKTYTVTLTVVDNGSSKDNDTIVVVVLDREPTANFSFTPQNPDEGQIVYFNASNSTGYDQPLNYSWDFGDGNVTTTASSTITHSFITTQPNSPTQTFLVTLTVTDADGSTDSISKQIIVNDLGPKANATVNNTNPKENELVFFDASLSKSWPDEIISYMWYFDDGNEKGINTTHAFATNGTHNITLIVTDNDGSQDIYEFSIDVGNDAPIVNLTADKTQGKIPLIVTFTCSVTNGNEPFFYNFTFDGNVTNLTTEARSVTFTITYDSGMDGIYYPRCIVTDADGDQGEDNVTLKVYDIVINEIYANGTSDWVELYNRGNNDYFLSGWNISDSAGHNKTISGLISSHGFLNISMGNWLNDGGDSVILYDEIGNLIDQYSYSSSLKNVSIGRYKDGEAWREDLYPTPNAQNRLPECNDGQDNDGDGLVDYGPDPSVNDPQCSNIYDDSEAHNSGPSQQNLAPTVTLISPDDNNIINTNSVTLTYNVTDDNSSILNCSIFTNVTGVWKVNDTQQTTNGTTNSTTLTGLADGSYIWNVQCCDSQGNCSFASANWTFTINTAAPVQDTQAPIVTINSPQNKEYASSQVLINITTIDPEGHLDGVWYNIDGKENKTYLQPILSDVLADGVHILYAFGNDTYGHIGNNSVSFTINITQPVTDTGWIYNSWIDGVYYPNNSTQAFDNINDTIINNTIINDSKNITIINSTLNYGDLTSENGQIKLTNVDYCNFTLTNPSGSTKIFLNDQSPCEVYYTNDPVETSNNTQQGSGVINLTGEGKVVNNILIAPVTIVDSNVTHSTVENVYIENSTLDNTTAKNSTITNSQITNAIIENAYIEDNIIYNGTVDGNNITTPTNLSELINYLPIAILTASSTSGNVPLGVVLNGSQSYDPNEGTALNDSIVNYTWYINGNEISECAGNETCYYTFANAGSYTINLTVIDSYGLENSTTIQITATEQSTTTSTSSGGSGGAHLVSKPKREPDKPDCVRDYYCANWSACVDGKQTCLEWIDRNNCGPIYNPPTKTRDCEVQEQEKETTQEEFVQEANDTEAVETTGMYALELGPIKLTKEQLIWIASGVGALVLIFAGLVGVELIRRKSKKRNQKVLKEFVEKGKKIKKRKKK